MLANRLSHAGTAGSSGCRLLGSNLIEPIFVEPGPRSTGKDAQLGMSPVGSGVSAFDSTADWRI